MSAHPMLPECSTRGSHPLILVERSAVLAPGAQEHIRYRLQDPLTVAAATLIRNGDISPARAAGADGPGASGR
jgi:hypothetical protein